MASAQTCSRWWTQLRCATASDEGGLAERALRVLASFDCVLPHTAIR